MVRVLAYAREARKRIHAELSDREEIGLPDHVMGHIKASNPVTMRLQYTLSDVVRARLFTEQYWLIRIIKSMFIRLLV